jgi:hypothetical protein
MIMHDLWNLWPYDVWKCLENLYIWEYHLNIEPIISIITIRKNFTKAYGHIICGNLYVI